MVSADHDSADQDSGRSVGSGTAVYTDDAVVEGPTLWLETPEDVLDFVDGDAVEDTIAIVRGGTTTFLTPALIAGVKGVITLQGAVTSHLGIVSREYGIPCLMSVTFDEGVRTSRGDLVPPDGAIVRMDMRAATGHVLVHGDTPLGERAEQSSGPAGPDPEILKLLKNYRGEVPHGEPGEQIMRGRHTTRVLDLVPGSLDHDELTRDESNDLIDFMGWSFWDWLAERADEGESTLIPRPQYESLGMLQMWHGTPRWYRAIHDEVGADGVREIGALARREIGTKVKLIQIHSTGMGPVFGRGVALELGQHDRDFRREDIGFSLQFMRRLYAGMWDDDGSIFTSGRGYTARTLEDSWIERFRAERETTDGDPARRQFFQKFNGTTELLAFLMHFDNRLGVDDTGPYPVPGGGWMIVRTLILNDPAYAWTDCLGDGVPYAVTQAMFFADEPPIEKSITEGGTLFTVPENYLQNLNGMAVYARDRWDTPVEQVRRVREAEMAGLQKTIQQASNRMYQRIVGMSDFDKIMCGLQVYGFDYVIPFARAAGVYDRLVAEGYRTVDPLTEQAYEQLMDSQRATETVVKLFISGSGFQPLP